MRGNGEDWKRLRLGLGLESGVELGLGLGLKTGFRVIGLKDSQ